MNINDRYQSIIKKCRFISKPDKWFVEGTEATLGNSYNEYMEGDIFNDGWALFNGLTNEKYTDHKGILPREDGESCRFDEFWIYDEHGNEISELNLNEYNQLLRKIKLEQLNENR